MRHPRENPPRQLRAPRRFQAQFQPPVSPLHQLLARAPIVHDQWTLRDGDWKLILPRGRGGKAGKGAQAGGELFNLRSDPAEQHNLFSEESERAERMQAQLKAILAK